MDERLRLKSPSLGERIAAAESLSLSGEEAAQAAVELVEACVDQEEVREFAVAALEALGPPPAADVPRLISLASRAEPLAAYWAVTLLGRAGAEAKSSESTLSTILASTSDSSVRERAAWALGQIEADSPTTLAALEKASGSSDARLARLAQASLNQITAN